MSALSAVCLPRPRTAVSSSSSACLETYRVTLSYRCKPPTTLMISQRSMCKQLVRTVGIPRDNLVQIRHTGGGGGVGVNYRCCCCINTPPSRILYVRYSQQLSYVFCSRISLWYTAVLVLVLIVAHSPPVVLRGAPHPAHAVPLSPDQVAGM